MYLSNKQTISVSKSTHVQALRPEKNEAFNSEMYLRYDFYDHSSENWLINFFVATERSFDETSPLTLTFQL
jgi:hypothetical protein